MPEARKLRLFQPHQYISLDYEKQAAVAFSVSEGQQIGFDAFQIPKQEPLKLEVQAFLNSVVTRAKPLVDGEQGTKALMVALDILAKIEEHALVVSKTLEGQSI